MPLDYQPTLAYAQQQDATDPLRSFRARFHFPQKHGQDAIYFCGNSLGLQPKAARAAMEAHLLKWEQMGVEGHFAQPDPWVAYHKQLTPAAARLVGAQEDEVVIMNGLTVNLHLLLVSFYRPTAQRFKVIMEGGAFPSDQYAVASQLRFHGYDPATAIVELTPRPGEETLRTEDITAKIRGVGDELALVMLGGVNYYTGQFFDLKAITAAGHAVGATVGVDLAHAAGNVRLALHDWGVDFACWCTYKYLNSGPGGMSGVFIHNRYAERYELPRFAGWWGHDEAERFQMDKTFKPMRGAEGWQLCNAPIAQMVLHKVALDLHDEAGMEALTAKSRRLTGYLEFLIERFNQQQDQLHIRIITPAAPEQRGCQLSLVVSGPAAGKGKAFFDLLTEGGLIADWREPDVIRVAPAPIYNSFTDCYRFYELLGQTVPQLAAEV